MLIQRLFFCLVFCVSVFAAGCGGNDGPVRVPLEGSVTSTDIPGDLNGTISLQPASGTKGPAANGLVKSGHYQFTTADGPVVGTHRVLIDVEPPRGKMDRAAEQSALQWKFEMKVTVPSDPPYKFDFDLVRESVDASYGS